MHELVYWDKANFTTLTYNDDNLPVNFSLKKTDLQLFFKRLRMNYGNPIKYFACGEYGDTTERPHYHSIIFGISNTQQDQDLIQKTWPYGFTSVGYASPESIRYTAQYIDKKFSGDLAEIEYIQRGREPVFRIGSQGLGKRFLIDYRDRFLRDGYVSQFGVKHSLPRYYIKLLNDLGYDTDFLSANAQNNDINTVKEFTDFDDLSSNDLYMRSSSEYKKYYERLTQRRDQTNKNLKSRLNLKKRVAF